MEMKFHNESYRFFRVQYLIFSFMENDMVGIYFIILFEKLVSYVFYINYRDITNELKYYINCHY